MALPKGGCWIARLSQEAQEWWNSALLGQATSAHPVFGHDVEVQVENGVVFLDGTVGTADEADKLEREAHGLDTVRAVVNRLRITRAQASYHMQTVIALFPDADTARLACQAASSWKMHDAEKSRLLDSVDQARRVLRAKARAAQAPARAIEEFVDALHDGKVLLVDRVREDDALRIISELEGSNAEKVRTLPPEPESAE